MLASENGAEPLSPGAILALAYPDRVAKNRGGNGSFLLANGRGANVDPASSLSRESFLAVAEISGAANQSRILLAAAISPEDIDEEFDDHIVARDDVTFDPQSMSLRARTSRQLGAIALSERPMKVPATEETGQEARGRHRGRRFAPFAVDQSRSRNCAIASISFVGPRARSGRTYRTKRSQRPQRIGSRRCSLERLP